VSHALYPSPEGLKKRLLFAILEKTPTGRAIIFTRLRPQDIIQAALGEQKIPSGITRHIIPARALNINFPVGILMSSWSLEHKREWLHDWLMERMAANAIRYYAEATFSFNE